MRIGRKRQMTKAVCKGKTMGRAVTTGNDSSDVPFGLLGSFSSESISLKSN